MRQYFFTISDGDSNATRLMISAASLERACAELQANFAGARIESMAMGAYVPGMRGMLKAN